MMRKLYWLLASLIFSALFGIVSINTAKEDSWARKADMPTARWSFATSAVNGKIYAIGGWSSSTQRRALSIMEEYDPATNRWTKKTEMPTPRAGLSTSVVNGKIYAIGGWPGDGSLLYALVNVEEYDPIKETWAKRADMPTARANFSTCVVQGKIYAIGGRTTGGVVLSVVEEYNPATDKWTRKPDMPTPRTGLSTSAVNGKIYAIGGARVFSAIPTFSPVEEYDPLTGKWLKKTSMPTARMGFSTSAVNGKIYAIGGAAGPFVPGLTVVEEYNPTMDKWAKKTSMPTARGYLSSSVMKGKIYAIGGATGCGYSCAGITLAAVEEYEISYDISNIE